MLQMNNVNLGTQKAPPSGAFCVSLDAAIYTFSIFTVYFKDVVPSLTRLA